jgi:hypothetical protein
MERIKQAIENAKKPEAGITGASAGSPAARSTSSKPAVAGRGQQRNVIKYVSAAVLIFFAGWLWLRLDFMNQLEQIASQYIHDGIKNARAEAKRRTEAEAKFRQLIQANLDHCREAAERDNESYMKLAQKEVRVRNKNSSGNGEEKYYIPKAALSEAARMLESARAECQRIYVTQLSNGK